MTAQQPAFTILNIIGDDIAHFISPHETARFLREPDMIWRQNLVVLSQDEPISAQQWLAAYDEFAPYLTDAPRTDAVIVALSAEELALISAALLNTHMDLCTSLEQRINSRSSYIDLNDKLMEAK